MKFILPTDDDLARLAAADLSVMYAIWRFAEQHIHFATPFWWSGGQHVCLLPDHGVLVPRQLFFVFMEAEFGFADGLGYFWPVPATRYYTLGYPDFCKFIKAWNLTYTWSSDSGWTLFHKGGTFSALSDSPIEFMDYTDAVRIHPSVSYTDNPITALD